MKVQNLTPLSLSVFIFALARERSFIKTHSTERRRVIGQENIVCRCIHAAFSPEISQAGAVKGLKYITKSSLKSGVVLSLGVIHIEMSKEKVSESTVFKRGSTVISDTTSNFRGHTAHIKNSPSIHAGESANKLNSK